MQKHWKPFKLREKHPQKPPQSIESYIKSPRTCFFQALNFCFLTIGRLQKHPNTQEIPRIVPKRT